MLEINHLRRILWENVGKAGPFSDHLPNLVASVFYRCSIRGQPITQRLHHSILDTTPPLQFPVCPVWLDSMSWILDSSLHTSSCSSPCFDDRPQFSHKFFLCQISPSLNPHHPQLSTNFPAPKKLFRNRAKHPKSCIQKTDP